jgi:hypothetical protein
MPMGKPDLKINIPGATAPELPYSQRPQAAGADPSRLHKVRRRFTELSWGENCLTQLRLPALSQQQHVTTAANMRSCVIAYCCGKHDLPRHTAVFSCLQL